MQTWRDSRPKYGNRWSDYPRPNLRITSESRPVERFEQPMTDDGKAPAEEVRDNRGMRSLILVLLVIALLVGVIYGGLWWVGMP